MRKVIILILAVLIITPMGIKAEITNKEEMKEEINENNKQTITPMSSGGVIKLTKTSGEYAQSHVVGVVETNWTELYFVWTTSTTFPTTGFNKASTNTQALYTPSETGEYYLHLKGLYNGKETKYTAGPYRVDLESPNLNIVPDTTSWTNNVKITAQGTDSHSGVDKVYLKSNENNKNIVSMYDIQYWGGQNIQRTGNKIRITSNQQNRGGFYIPPNKLEHDQEYVLSFKIKKISGSIPIIGGHLHLSTHAEVYIDGNRVTSPYIPTSQYDTSDWGKGVDYPNDTNTHEIVVKFKADRYNNITDKTVYVQINRRHYDYSYTVELWDIQLEKGTEHTPYEPNMADLVEPSNPFIFNTTKNGVYTFVAVDKAGNSIENNITINNIDTTLPVIELELNTTESTHEDIIITATATDITSGVKRIKLPDGTWVNGDNVTYTATSNGEYEFTVEDNAGNVVTKTILVDNIVRTLSMESLSNILDFEKVILNDKTEKVSIPIKPIIISDWRDNDNNWKLSVSASQLKHDEDDYELPKGTINIKGIDKINRLEGNENMPINSILTTVAIDGGQVEVVRGNQSRGKYELVFLDDAIEIVINPYLVKRGKYKSTITWEIVNSH